VLRVIMLRHVLPRLKGARVRRLRRLLMMRRIESRMVEVARHT